MRLVIITVLLISSMLVASTPRDPYWLETCLDSAEATRNADSKITIYTNVLAVVSSNELATTYYDGARALFVTWAGLSWAYLHKADTNYFPLGLNYGLRARQFGYATGLPGINPERFSNNLHILSLYYERDMFSDADQREYYYTAAWETWPYFNADMLNLWRRKRALVYYSPKEAIPLSLEVVNNAPFCNTLFYRNCGWHYILLEEYREAFHIWCRGLIDGEPFFWNSVTPPRIIEYIEYATLDELLEIKRLFQVNAAKYPATMDHVQDVIGWLRWADNKHLNFEIALRTAEENSEAEIVTNMLLRAIRSWGRPLYAEKLGDTNMLVHLYCDRMKQEVWWWSMPEYSLLPKVQALLDSGTVSSNTAAYYQETLNYLRENHPRYRERNPDYFQ